MNLNWKAYVVLASVFLLSLGGAYLFPPDHDLLRSMIAAPGVVALLSALFQLMRDEAEFEKRSEAQRREFQFSLGAASHMANVAFDKHAEFCEKYMKELRDTVRTLYREGDSPAALNHAAKLYEQRQEFASWLTDKIDNDLEEFESALRTLGADAGFVRSTAGHAQYADERMLRINSNFDLFSRILGIRRNEEIPEKSMVETLKARVRTILRVEELTNLREHLIKQACNAIGA